MRLSSGYIIVGAYADKVRRTLFAQLRDRIKEGEIDSKSVAKAAADLNKLLYEIFVNKLRLDKGDVVRVMVEYDVEEGEVKWNFDTLTVEVFKRVPEDEIRPAVEDAVRRLEELEVVEEGPKLVIERAGETDLGDQVYFVNADGEFAGAIVVTPLNGEAIVRGAVVKPTPLVIERTKIEVEESLEDTLIRVIEEKGKEVDEETAERIIEDIREMLE